MDFRVFSRNISENMHARCVREDTKQALKGNLQADGVQSRQTLFVRYCPWAIPQKNLPVCRFLVKLHRSAFPYAKIPAKFLCNLLKNLIIYLLYKLSVALPLIFLQNRGILFLKQYHFYRDFCERSISHEK